MQQVFKDDNFMSRIVQINANFFLQMSQFCIKQLDSHFSKALNNQQLEDEEIYRQIERTQDPEILKLFEQSESESEEQQKQLQINVRKSRKSKTKQKPNFKMFKPKAPITSYLLFLLDNKTQIAAKYKLTNISDITKVASQQWKKLSETQKEKYCKKSEEQKAKYKEAMTIYKEKYANQINQDKRRRQSGYKIKNKINKNRIKQKKLGEIIEEDKSESKQLGNKSSQSQQYDVVLIDRSEKNSIQQGLGLYFTSL